MKMDGWMDGESGQRIPSTVRNKANRITIRHNTPPLIRIANAGLSLLYVVVSTYYIAMCDGGVVWHAIG